MVWPKSNNLELDVDVEELLQYMTTTNDSGPFSDSSENKNSSENSPSSSNQHHHEHSFVADNEDDDADELLSAPTEILSTPTNVHEQRNLS
jgi:hypothetical protein